MLAVSFVGPDPQRESSDLTCCVAQSDVVGYRLRLGSLMRRREFIALVGSAVVSWPRRAHAQKRPVRIGFLASGSENSVVGVDRVAAIKEGLRDNGLVEGRDYVLETRSAAGDYARFPE